MISKPAFHLSKLLLGDSNSQSTHKNKALSLEILIYQVKLPRKDKKSNLNRILPTEDDVEQAAKIASLLTHLSEDMQNSLASLLTNGDYKYWTKASIEKPKELLKAYLKYLATPIKDPKEYWWSSFRRDELYRYDSNLFDDETEMSQENSIKISRYNKLIDTVFLQQEKTMKDEKLRKKNKNKAVNLQKEMHLKNSQKTAKEICLLPPKIGSTNTGTMNPPAAVVTPQKNLSHSIEVIHSDSDPKNERLYCICNQYSYGNMIKCDNNFCKQEWFHYACVHVSSPPKGNWYCPNCANLEERSPIRHARARTFRQEAQPSKLTSEKRRKVE